MTKKKAVTIPAEVARRAATKYIETILGCHESELAPGCDPALIGWSVKGRKHCATVARAAWVHHHGQQLKPGDIIRASCGNKRCVRRAHLYRTTRAEVSARVARARTKPVLDEWPL